MSIFKGTTEPSKIYYGAEVQVSDMQGPCPNGFHVPLQSEWEALYNAGISMGAWTASTSDNLKQYLFMPLGGLRNCVGNANLYNQNYNGDYRTASRIDSTNAYIIYFNTGAIYSQAAANCTYGLPIRPFKDTPVAPDNSGDWTSVYTSGSAGIWRNVTLGLLSISSDGTNWITIADKNLGATTLYTNGATLSEANCGHYYQRGNNYGFPMSATVTTSPDKVDATGYGPGNYYSSSTYITAGYTDWSSVENDNLRGGVTQGTYPSGETDIKEVTAVYLGEDKVRPTTPAYQPVWDYMYSGSDITNTYYVGNTYYGLRFKPKLNCTLDKVKFVADWSGTGDLAVFDGSLNNLYSGGLTAANTAGGEYTLATPVQLTAGNDYIVTMMWYDGYYRRKQATQTLTGTNVDFLGFIVGTSFTPYSDYIINVRGVETTQTA